MYKFINLLNVAHEIKFMFHEVKSKEVMGKCKAVFVYCLTKNNCSTLST